MKRRIAFKPRAVGCSWFPRQHCAVEIGRWQISEPRVLNRAQQRLQRMSLFRLTWTPWKIVWKKPVDVFEQGESFWAQFAMNTPKSKSRGAKSAAVPKPSTTTGCQKNPMPDHRAFSDGQLLFGVIRRLRDTGKFRLLLHEANTVTDCNAAHGCGFVYGPKRLWAVDIDTLKQVR